MMNIIADKMKKQKQKYHTVGIVQNPIEKSEEETKAILLTHKYMTDHLNRTIQMFGSLEHVVAIKTVSIGQSKVPSSIIYLRITQG
jgi:hypothetical protein